MKSFLSTKPALNVVNYSPDQEHFFKICGSPPEGGAMSLFICSVLVGLLLHQIVSIIQPIDEGKTCVFGQRIVVHLPEKTYLVFKAIVLVTAILLFIFIATIIVAQSVHPTEGYAYRFTDALTSPRMGAAIFGGLVGILLRNLLNRLLKNTDDYNFKASDYLEIALIAVLVILGIGGEEVVRSYAQRINKISVGTTTEISFSEATPKASRTSAEQPGGAFRNTQGDSGQSAGLAKLYDIGSNDNKSNISRDGEFIEVLSRYELEPKPDPVDPGALAPRVLSPIASCLSGIFLLNGDSTFIEQQLVLLNDPLRELATSDSPDPKKIKDQLLAPIDHLTDYVGPRWDQLQKIGASDKRYSCADFQDIAEMRKALDAGSIEAFNKTRVSRPYAAMAYAAAMAALHHYEPAVIAMDNWIIKAKDRIKESAAKPPANTVSAANTVADRWYLLRARLTQGLFFNEWIRQRGLSASSWLRLYHIENLKAIADEMQSFVAISELSKKNNDFKLTTGPIGASESGDDGLCSIPDLPKAVAAKSKNSGTPAKATAQDAAPEQEVDKLTKAAATERLRTIYTTYLSAKSDYVDQALKHPIMKRRSAGIIGSEAKGLMSLSLRCITNNLQIARAEDIERYVRNEINLIDQTLSLKSKDSIMDRIRDNRQMLALAFQLIEPAVSTATEGKNKGRILDRIATDRVLEVYETLLATQDQLESFSERDVLN